MVETTGENRLSRGGSQPMTTLQSFGDTPPPDVKVESAIPHPKNRQSVIGHIGYDEERDERIAMLPRDTEEHYFRKYQGYAVSRSVLEHFKSRNVDKVCIVETNDERRVIEFQLHQFKSGEFVAYDDSSNTIVESEIEFENNRAQYDDPQQVLAVQQSVLVWDKSEISIHK